MAGCRLLTLASQRSYRNYAATVTASTATVSNATTCKTLFTKVAEEKVGLSNKTEQKEQSR